MVILLLLQVLVMPQCCLAMRRLEDTSSYSFSRLGSLPLSAESLTFWRYGKRHHHNIVKAASSSSSPSRTTRVFPDNYHGLTLPTPSSSLREDDDDRDMVELQPASVKGKVRRRRRRGNEKQLSQSSTESSATTTTTTTISSKELAIQLSRPLIPQDAWEVATGLEFQDPELVESLVQSGLELCNSQGDEDPNVEWFTHSSTEKLLDEYGDRMRALEEDGHVLVYVGKARKEGVVGSHLPLIKTQSILPLGAEEMANLLMDSSRVKIYNKMSLGRKDIRILNRNTKIVRNLTQPPVTSSKMVTVTLMHSRPLRDTDPLMADTSPYKNGYVVVSRAVPGVIDDAELADLARNEILIGVNLLQEISPNECLMTAVTHVYSPALPAMFASSMGVKSAVDFIRDIRHSCQPVASN